MQYSIPLVCALALCVWPAIGYPYPYYQPVAEPSREMMPPDPRPMPGPMVYLMPQRRGYTNSLERYQENFYSFLLKLVSEGGTLTVSIGKPESGDYESQYTQDGEQTEDEDEATTPAISKQESSTSTKSTGVSANATKTPSNLQDDGDSDSDETNTTDDWTGTTAKPIDETTSSSSVEIQDSNVVSRLMEPPEPNDSLKDAEVPVWL